MDKKNFLILLSCTVIAAFLGAFLASSLIFNKKPVPPPMPAQLQKKYSRPQIQGGFENAMEHKEEIFEREMDFFNRFESDMEDLIEHSPNMAGFIQMNNVGLKTIETPNEYKIEIDLKPFGKDTKNIDIKTRGNTVKISAGYKSKDRNNYNSSQFYQAITLPAKIDSNVIKKERNGDILTVIIPKK